MPVHYAAQLSRSPAPVGLRPPPPEIDTPSALTFTHPERALNRAAPARRTPRCTPRWTSFCIWICLRPPAPLAGAPPTQTDHWSRPRVRFISLRRREYITKSSFDL